MCDVYYMVLGIACPGWHAWALLHAQLAYSRRGLGSFAAHLACLSEETKETSNSRWWAMAMLARVLHGAWHLTSWLIVCCALEHVCCAESWALHAQFTLGGVGGLAAHLPF